MKRAIIIVLDSLGVGALPDAGDYGDLGADTFGHILESHPELKIPGLLSLGFGNIENLAQGKLKQDQVKGSFARLAEASKGKDTITGHWEIAGIFTERSFKTYPDGFPDIFMKEFEEAIGRETLGNYAASGTEIIEELGPEHERTGKPIVYTSADSVFQVAANTDVIPLDELYRICETARKMLVGDFACGRVIARPYVLTDGKRVRTSDRKDYAVSPPLPTLLDGIKGVGQKVKAIGKISDIFNGKGITDSIHTESNLDGVERTIETIKEDFTGLIFTNLVDFDSKFGHRRNAVGYGEALEEFDVKIPEILENMKEQDILFLCADHGNDPIHSGWDHTREYIPLVIYGKGIKAGIDLKTRNSFADIGATIAEYLATPKLPIGESFLSLILK